MDVVGVKARGVQPHRPAAVEAPAAVIATAQRIGAVADVIQLAADGRGEGAEQRADTRVGAARLILRSLRAMSQGWNQYRVAVGAVQAAGTDTQVRTKAALTRPRGRR